MSRSLAMLLLCSSLPACIGIQGQLDYDDLFPPHRSRTCDAELEDPTDYEPFIPFAGDWYNPTPFWDAPEASVQLDAKGMPTLIGNTVLGCDAGMYPRIAGEYTGETVVSLSDRSWHEQHTLDIVFWQEPTAHGTVGVEFELNLIVDGIDDTDSWVTGLAVNPDQPERLWAHIYVANVGGSTSREWVALQRSPSWEG